jgi:hypothetical protein
MVTGVVTIRFFRLFRHFPLFSFFAQQFHPRSRLCQKMSRKSTSRISAPGVYDQWTFSQSPRKEPNVGR